MAHFAYTLLLLPFVLLIGSMVHRTPRAVQAKTEQLLFISDRAGGGRWDIFCVDVDGRDLRQLTRDFGRHMSPAWSPDGSRIAFESRRDGNPDIYTMEADGSDLRRLTREPVLEEYPRWSPDGQRIAFTVGNEAIFVMGADGSNRRRVTQDHFFTAGSMWRPSGSF